MTVRAAKKQKRRAARQNESSDYRPNTGLNLTHIAPLTDNQNKVFEAFQESNLLLTGTAGTGKTFLAIYLALRDILETREQNKLVLVRSVVPSRDMGYLPGNTKEKMRAYEAPYYSIFDELFERGDAYDILKSKGVVDFISTSFVRGTTINDAVVVVDEIQNMNAIELHSVFTRIGRNCRVILCGDIKQNDLVRYKDVSGYPHFVAIIKRMKSFKHVEFNRDDVVRSELVKEYIITRDDMEERGEVPPLG